MTDQRPSAPVEPLPIWFFVGLILSVYGVIILVRGLFPAARATVLAATRPALWWGGVIIAAGVIFLAVGLRGRGDRDRTSGTNGANQE